MKKNILRIMVEASDVGQRIDSEIGSSGFSKSIRFTGWRFQDQSAALLNDGRTPDSFRGIIQVAFPNPRDWRALLTASGVPYNTAKQQTRRLLLDEIE